MGEAVINFKELTPAPWTAEGREVVGPTREDMVIYDEGGHGTADAQFIALARNAFDVMMRREWTESRDPAGNWFPVEAVSPHYYPLGLMSWVHKPFRHPYLSLVEADAYLTAQEKEEKELS